MSRAGSAVFFLAIFAIYFLGQSGAIPSYRDAGDFIAAIPQFGISHPPGYPVYTLFGRLWLLMTPWANAAYRLNLLSAVAAAATGIVLIKAASRLGATTGAAVVAALLWATSPAVVDLSRVAEMYTLAALACAALLWAAESAIPSRLAFFLFGIAMAVHPTLVFLAPLLPIRKLRRSEEWVAAALFIAAGLSLYLFLPIRAAQSPVSNWGDPSHWRNFWRVVTRADYGGLRLHPVQSQFQWSSDDLVTQLTYFFETFGREWRWIGLALGAWGFWISRKKTMGLAASWVLLGPGFFVLSNLPLGEPTTAAILQPYLVVAGVLWTPFVALGVSALVRQMPAISARALTAGLAFLIFGYGAAAAARTSHRADFFAYDYGRNLLRSLPPRAVLYDPDDPTAFTVRALQITEGRRLDIAPLNFFRTRWGYEQIRRRYPELLPAEDIPNAQALQAVFWNYSLHKRPFFVELPQKLGGVPYRAEGLAYAVNPAPASDTLRRGENNFTRYVIRGRVRTDRYADFFTRHLIDYYAAAHTNLGLDFAAARQPDRAIAEYKAALCIDPELAAAYNDWGVVEYNAGRYAQALSLYRCAVAFDPQNAGFQKNLELTQHRLQRTSSVPGI